MLDGWRKADPLSGAFIAYTLLVWIEVVIQLFIKTSCLFVCQVLLLSSCGMCGALGLQPNSIEDQADFGNSALIGESVQFVHRTN